MKPKRISTGLKEIDKIMDKGYHLGVFTTLAPPYANTCKVRNMVPKCGFVYITLETTKDI